MVTPDNRSQTECAPPNQETLPSPGEQLRQAREAIGATLKVIAARTRISETTLYHLEQDMYDEFAVEIFLKGHLRSYARELGLNPEEIIHSYEVFVGLIPECGDALEVSSCTDLVVTQEGLPAPLTTQDAVRRSLATSREERALHASQNLRASASKRENAFGPRISPQAVSGKNRKVIGRFDSQEMKANVRRGPCTTTENGRTSAIRLTKPLFSLAEKLFVSRPPEDMATLSTAEASAPIIRQRLNGSLTDGTPNANALRRSSQSFRNEMRTVPPKSKLERAIPQLKQFGAKHYLAIIIVLVLSVITAGLLSGNRATAQDPAKFPKNSQDSWELERQAEQTRWLLEQPDSNQSNNSSDNSSDSN